ncbi:MAG: hypothetical protein DSZ06_03950, partial [Sulfurospirillum sp.]
MLKNISIATKLTILNILVFAGLLYVQFHTQSSINTIDAHIDNIIGTLPSNEQHIEKEVDQYISNFK